MANSIAFITFWLSVSQMGLKVEICTQPLPEMSPLVMETVTNLNQDFPRV